MSLQPSSLAEIRYECPVCFTALFPPVFQCKNGHLVCESCHARLKNCGICRVPLSKSKVRNLEVERIIRVMQHPCPNEDDGCQAMLKFDQIEDHRMECKYTKFPICREILGYDCEGIRIIDFVQHLVGVHEEEFFDARSQALPVIYKAAIILEKNCTCTMNFRLKVGPKSVLAVLVVKCGKASDFVKWKPYILAGRAVTDQLGCKISLLSGKNVKIMSESPLFNLQSKPEDLQSCLSLSFMHLQNIFGAPSDNVEDAVFVLSFRKKTESPPNDATDSASTMEIST